MGKPQEGKHRPREESQRLHRCARGPGAVLTSVFKVTACCLSSNVAWTPILDQPKQGTKHRCCPHGLAGAADWRQTAEMVRYCTLLIHPCISALTKSPLLTQTTKNKVEKNRRPAEASKDQTGSDMTQGDMQPSLPVLSLTASHTHYLDSQSAAL